MKKYILHLFPNNEKQPQSVFELAMLVALFNHDQPELNGLPWDFINWLQNNLSEPFFRYESLTDATGERLHIDVLFFDETKRAGYIDTINTL